MRRIIMSSDIRISEIKKFGLKVKIEATNDTKYTKKILTDIMKKNWVLIEIFNTKEMILSTYIDLKMLGRTADTRLLLYDYVTHSEIELDIELIEKFMIMQ